MSLHMWVGELNRIIVENQLQIPRQLNMTVPFHILTTIISAFMIIKYIYGLEYYNILLNLHGLHM